MLPASISWNRYSVGRWSVESYGQLGMRLKAGSMYMGFESLNPDWLDSPAAAWLERLRPLDICEGSVDTERLLDGYAHGACRGTVSGNGCEEGYVCVKFGVTVCELTSGISSLPSSNILENFSSPYNAGVDVASDCSE